MQPTIDEINSPIRRSRSLELRQLLTTRRQSYPVNRRRQSITTGPKMNEIEHGPHFESFYDLAEFTNTLKNKVKSAFKKSPRTSDTESLHSCSQNSTPVRSTRPKDRLQLCRSELDRGLRYFQEVVRTDKTEMIGGSTSIILDSIVHFLSIVKHPNYVSGESVAFDGAFERLYRSLIAFIRWADGKVVEKVEKKVSNDANKRDSFRPLYDELLAAVDALILMVEQTKLDNRTSTDSGNITCTTDDSFSAPPLPPRREKVTKRASSPPTSQDSGIFNETDSLPMVDENLNNTQNKLFRDGSLNDLLAHLNVAETMGQGTPEVDKSGQVCEEETKEIVNGKIVRTIRTRRHISLTKSTSHQTVTLSGSAGADDLLRKLRKSPSGQLTLVENEQVASKGQRRMVVSEHSNPQEPTSPPPIPPRLRKQRVPSFYDNNHSTPPNSAPVTPERRVSGHQSQKILQHSTTVQAFSHKTSVNGKIVSDDAVEKLNESLIRASKSATFEKGQMVSVKGGGLVESRSMMKKMRSENGQPPPVPPRRQNVVHYMKLFDMYSDSDNPRTSKEVSQKQVDFRKSTLASYVVLRDNLCQYEELNRKKAFSVSPSHQLPPMQAPRHEYCNLESVLSFGDHDRLRLPIKFVETEQKPVQWETRLALPAPAPSVLTTVDVTDFLVLRSCDAELEEVRGGPIDGLIVYASQPGANLLLYQEAFLTTYRTFAKPLDLIERLLTRYNHFALGYESSSKKVARNTFSLLVRVVDELSCVELLTELIEEVNGFIYRLIGDGELNLARLLRQILVERIEEKAGFKKILPPPTPTAVPLPQRLSNLYEFKSSVIAEQLTCIDSELFQKMDLSEMLYWAREQSEEKSPNLVIFTEHFNKMSYWVRTRVLKQPEHKERERMLLKFVKVMKHLRRMGNFNSFLALLSALDSGPVRRLEWSKAVVEALRDHSAIMDSSQSFRNYRTALAGCRPPCLPYIGLILQDLTFIHVGNPDYLPAEKCQGRKDLINFGKRWQQFAILDSVRKFKSWQFEYEKDERVLKMFNNFDDYMSEDAIWELSESIKPRPSSRRPPIVMSTDM